MHNIFCKIYVGNSFTIFIFCLLSCNNEKNIDSKKNVPTIKQEKIIRYYEGRNDRNSKKELSLQHLGKVMGLPNVSNLNDDLYIRIWIWDAEKKFVINLKYDETSKECHIADIDSKKTDSAEYIIIHREWMNIKPKSGWDNFYKALQKHQILNLKGETDYGDTTAVSTSMSSIQFEIAQSHTYRFYEYSEPSYYRYVDAGASNVHEFLEYLNTEMDVHVYRPDKRYFKEAK
jgi:hypothetical protein